MAIITNLKSKGNALSAQTFSVKGVELKIGGQYAISDKSGQVLYYNHATKSMELMTLPDGGGLSALGKLDDSGVYTDGLIPLTETTKINDAIDKINEVLKALAPKNASPVSAIKIPSVAQGVNNAKLSFGFDSNPFTGYATPTSGVNKNNAYGKIRLTGTAFTLPFTVNGDVPADSKGAFPAAVFSDVNVGTLVAEVNGVEVASSTLESFGDAGGSVVKSGVTFNVGAVQYVLLDGQPMTSSPYRTATVTFNSPHIASNGFRKGWNTVKVSRQLTGKDINSTVVEFILLDAADAPALSISAPTMVGPTLTGLNHLSGVKYHTQADYTHSATVSNMYQLVYQSDNTAIAHTPSGLTTVSVAISGASLTSSNTTSLPQLEATSSGNTQQIGVTTVLRRTTNIYPTDSVSYSFTAKHPIKGTQASTTQSKTGLLLYTQFGSADVSTEDFKSESYRIKNADYSTLSYNGIDGMTWDSTIALNSADANHQNGLAIWKDRLVHAKQVGDLSSFGPAGNVNYSAMSSVGTFYRKFKIGGNGDLPYILLDLAGAGVFKRNDLSFDTTGAVASNNELSVSGEEVAITMLFLKKDGSKKVGFFNPLAVKDNNGGFGLAGAATVGSNNTGLKIEFPANFKLNTDDYIIVKIQAASTWTGNISNLKVRYA